MALDLWMELRVNQGEQIQIPSLAITLIVVRWRWIMIIEGLPSIVLGVIVYFWLADEPETAYYLTQEQRDLMVVRKRRQIGHTSSGDLLHKEDVIKAFKDWKVWMFAFGQFGVDTMLYGYSTFLPTIIKGLGQWSTAEIQALTVPCYALGAITYLVVAWASDRFQRRALAVVPFASISVIGYAILIADVSPGVHYFACFLVAMGLYVGVGIPLAWLPSSKSLYEARIFSGLQWLTDITRSTSLRETNNGEWTSVSGTLTLQLLHHKLTEISRLTIGNAAGIMAPFVSAVGI